MKKFVCIFIIAMLFVSCQRNLLVNQYDKNVNMELSGVKEKDTTALCFTARNGSVVVNFIIKNVTHTIQYSTDGINWYNYTSNRDVKINANQSIYFCAATNQTTATAFGVCTHITSDRENSSHFNFTSSDGGTVEGSGNIMSLYGPDCPDLPLQPGAFASLFYTCKTLTTAPELPATILAKNCYYKMFMNCDALTSAPELPATTMAEGCYYCMFRSCTSLTTPSELPATTLAGWCYSDMFENCSSLTTTPALPAITMDTACYQWMFYGCSSLTTIPELPATTLAEFCYNSMFSGCTSLVVNKTAPGKEWKIPATSTVGDHSVSDMFGGTSGTMNGTPEVNTTYYIASDSSY